MSVFVYRTHPRKHIHKPGAHTSAHSHTPTFPSTPHRQLPLTPEKTATSVSTRPPKDNFSIHILPSPTPETEAQSSEWLLVVPGSPVYSKLIFFCLLE